MTGEGIAAIILAVGTVLGQVGTIAMQFKQAKLSRATAGKIDEVHAATAAIAEQTGTHQVLPPGAGGP